MSASPPIHIREILFATDFSPHSDHAFLAALALAETFGARLHLLHVVHRAGELEAARARLNAFAEERVAAGKFTVAVAVGGPAREIVHYAEREKVGLIVMGTHGRTGLGHAVRGSVAEEVVRRGPCQVLTIRRAVEVPVEAAEPRPETGAPPAVHAHRCLICARLTEEPICDPCKALIQAEVVYRRIQEERPGR